MMPTIFISKIRNISLFGHHIVFQMFQSLRSYVKDEINLWLVFVNLNLLVACMLEIFLSDYFFLDFITDDY